MKGEGFFRLMMRCGVILKRFMVYSKIEINIGYVNRFKGILKNKEIMWVIVLVVFGVMLLLIVKIVSKIVKYYLILS